MYTGYDASAHVAEETVGARVASAWGLFLAVAVSAIVGFVFLVALSTHLPNLSTLFPATFDGADPTKYSQYYFGDGAAVIDTLIYNLGSTVGGVLAAGIAVAMWFCGLSSIASAGRMLYAFSRDDGVPGSGWLKVSRSLPDSRERARRDSHNRLVVLRGGVLRRQGHGGRHR